MDTPGTAAELGGLIILAAMLAAAYGLGRLIRRLRVERLRTTTSMARRGAGLAALERLARGEVDGCR